MKTISGIKDALKSRNNYFGAPSALKAAFVEKRLKQISSGDNKKTFRIFKSGKISSYTGDLMTSLRWTNIGP